MQDNSTAGDQLRQPAIDYCLRKRENGQLNQLNIQKCQL